MRRRKRGPPRGGSHSFSLIPEGNSGLRRFVLWSNLSAVFFVMELLGDFAHSRLDRCGIDLR